MRCVLLPVALSHPNFPLTAFAQVLRRHFHTPFPPSILNFHLLNLLCSHSAPQPPSFPLQSQFKSSTTFMHSTRTQSIRLLLYFPSFHPMSELRKGRERLLVAAGSCHCWLASCTGMPQPFCQAGSAIAFLPALLLLCLGLCPFSPSRHRSRQYPIKFRISHPSIHHQHSFVHQQPTRRHPPPSFSSPFLGCIPCIPVQCQLPCSRDHSRLEFMSGWLAGLIDRFGRWLMMIGLAPKCQVDRLKGKMRGEGEEQVRERAILSTTTIRDGC